MRIVQKYGGSSLADLGRLRRAAQIALEAQRRGNELTLVVSAAGDSTDELLALARGIMPRPPARELDALTATGEQRSAALMAIMLQSLGGRARSLTGWQAGIRTQPQHGEAAIEEIRPERLETLLAAGEIPVVAGFQGVDAAGEITTLGRGGSDTTAVALARSLGAGCEIYTDVDGVYTADPRLVPQARRMEEIDTRDMLRLAQEGAQVLHAPCVALVLEEGIEIRLLSAFRASGGTLIHLLGGDRPPLAGITRCEEKGTLSLVGRGADGALGERLLRALRREGLHPEPGGQAENCVRLKLPPAELSDALKSAHRILFE